MRLYIVSPYPQSLVTIFVQTSSTRTERDQLSEDRQLQIRQRAKLELDLKDLDEICNDDLATKVGFFTYFFALIGQVCLT